MLREGRLLMTDTAEAQYASGEVAEKGLKSGALGLVASVVIGVASTAPAYSLAATLGFIVAGIGLQSPVIVILAFVPMLFTAIGYSELNKADPDCGTTFTWATRAFGPKTGWLGGWGIIAADVLVMASLAQVAGQYLFLLFNADGIGGNPVELPRVAGRGAVDRPHDLDLLPGHRAVRAAAGSPPVHRADHAARLRCCRPGQGGDRERPRLARSRVSWSWFNPFDIDSFSTFFRGLLLDDLHLLGLGQRSRRQRGDRRIRQARPAAPLSSRRSCCWSPTRW